MPISTNSLLLWSDIQSIYNSLNTANQKFGAAQVSVPNNKNNLVVTTHLSNLVASVEALKSNKYVGNVAETNVTIPSRGTLIKPVEMNQIISTINNIQALCAHDSYYSANFTNDFTNDFSDDSSDFTNDFSHDDSDYTNDFSDHTTDFTNDFSHDGFSEGDARLDFG